MQSDRFRLALRELKPSDWERFEGLASVFIAADFPNLRTLATASGDAGRDGVLFTPTGKDHVVLQYSIAEDWKKQIRATTKRLAETASAVRVLIYVTNQRIGADADSLKRELLDQVGLVLDVRDASWFLDRLDADVQRSAAAERLAEQIVDPLLSEEGVTRTGQALPHNESRAGLLYLTLQWEPERWRLCQARQWEALTRSFSSQGKDKGTATRFTNELRLFFEDDGSTLWITFVGDCLYWGVLDKAAPERSSDGDGVCRAVHGGWRYTDLKGEPLTKDRLSGALTKLAAYRGTSCNVDISDYVIRRVNGQKTPEVEHALIASKEMKVAVLGLLRLLGPRDFELLVDLVFTTSGWRRVGIVGKTQKTLDLDLVLPSTGERAFVQVKSRTSSAELAKYVDQLDDTRMFYVFHSGEDISVLQRRYDWRR